MSTKKGALETVILPSSDEMNDYIIHGTGIFTFIYHKFKPYVGKYTIHGAYMGYTYCYYLSLSHDHLENSRSNMFPVPIECWIYVHPWKLTWNPKSWRFGRWFSFSNRWFSGSSRSFSRVYPLIKKPSLPNGQTSRSKSAPTSASPSGRKGAAAWKNHAVPTKIGEIQPAKSEFLKHAYQDGKTKTYRNNEMFWSGRLWFRLFRINWTLHQNMWKLTFCFVHCEASGH